MTSDLKPFALGAFGSFIAHVLIGAIILSSERWTRASILPSTPVIDVTFVTPPQKNNAAKEVRQIVSPPESSVPVTNDIPKKLSDRDATAPHEQIQRGDRPDAGPQAARESAPYVPAPVRSESAKQSPAQDRPKRLKHLTLDTSTVQARFGSLPAQSAQEKAQAAVNESMGTLSGHQAFSRATGSGARILGTRGSPDFLPNLPDGDITLLNTKANQFAVFVRRVALQVFSQLRASGWEALRANDIQAIRDDVMVRAILSPKGELIKVELESSSGSTRFDEVVSRSVQSGAKDPNPPPGAEARDGNIHFIFKSRSWSRLYAGGRDGAPGERRWLLLATGLD